MKRFVLLEHDWPSPHLDLLLEHGLVLRGWRLPAPLRAGIQTAVASADHRLAYLDYEGPVSGGRGTVRRLDRGNFSGTIEARGFDLMFHGGLLTGRMEFRHEDEGTWQVCWHPAS